jgi:hypothetical protein
MRYDSVQSLPVPIFAMLRVLYVVAMPTSACLHENCLVGLVQGSAGEPDLPFYAGRILAAVAATRRFVSLTSFSNARFCVYTVIDTAFSGFSAVTNSAAMGQIN